MIEPLVVKFLRDGGTLNDLLTTRGINSKRHKRYSNLVLLKYDQTESPMGDPIVRECRGIILDESDNWRVISRSLDKFFNYGEVHAPTIDWSKAVVQEKVDGSLMTVYAYDGLWHVSTTGTPDASGEVNGLDTSGTWSPRPGLSFPAPNSFAHYFWQTLSLYPGTPFSYAPSAPWKNAPPKDFSWRFELTGPLNRVVVPHIEARLTLLGARHVQTGRDLPLEEAAEILGSSIPPVQSYPLTSIEDILATFTMMSPLVQEGYVIQSGDDRIKTKHPGYVSLHHAKDGLSIRAFVRIAQIGEVPEALAVFPELRPQLTEVQNRYEEIIAATEKIFATYRHLSPKKTFAEAVKGFKNSDALFKMYDGKVTSARMYYSTRTVDSLMNLLGFSK